MRGFDQHCMQEMKIKLDAERTIDKFQLNHRESLNRV